MLYGQRRQNVLREITFCTDSYANSFFPGGVKNWNRIGFEVRKITSLNAFKKKTFWFHTSSTETHFWNP